MIVFIYILFISSEFCFQLYHPISMPLISCFFPPPFFLFSFTMSRQGLLTFLDHLSSLRFIGGVRVSHKYTLVLVFCVHSLGLVPSCSLFRDCLVYRILPFASPFCFLSFSFDTPVLLGFCSLDLSTTMTTMIPQTTQTTNPPRFQSVRTRRKTVC